MEARGGAGGGHGFGKKRPKKRFSGKQKYVNNNNKMHPRNKYAYERPDFQKLSEKYPELKEFLVYKNRAAPGFASINWKDEEALKALTKVLLKEDFKIDYWELPSDFLCPTITNRANYIHWIQDLLDNLREYDSETLTKFSSHEGREESTITGLDVGVGANCIYPLIGHSEYKWHFVGSEVNPGAIENAETIVTKNNLESAITIRKQEERLSLFKNGVITEKDRFCFTMCNPPFFASMEEVAQNPTTSCTANESEGVTEGGEQEFVKRMIDESEQFSDQVVWFTTMFGRKQSLKVCNDYLTEKFGQKTQILTTEFYQGKTTRWGLAWRFIDDLQGYMLKVLQVQREKRQKTE